jgi:hypothetical protein
MTRAAAGVITCPKCRGVAEPGSTECQDCGWVFARAEAPTVSAAPPVIVKRSRSTARMLVGLLGLLLILGAGAERCSTATLNRTASAVQITQVYTEGAFFVLVVLGAVVAFYVAVRPD